MPEVRPLIFEANGGGALSRPQARVLIGTQETPEFRIVVTRQALQPASEVTPQHGDAADQRRMRRQAGDRHRKVVERRGAHEILAEAGAQPSGPDAVVAGALRAQMNEANGFEIDALGDPAEHAGAVAVDAVPHHLTHEAADFLEAVDPIEFGHADRHLVAADLGHQLAGLADGRTRACPTLCRCADCFPFAPSGFRSSEPAGRDPCPACTDSRSPRDEPRPALHRRLQ